MTAETFRRFATPRPWPSPFATKVGDRVHRRCQTAAHLVPSALVELTTLRRTGLRVSIAGLGCGGHSRLGLSNGSSQHQAVAVVHRALDLGINLIDTARAYGTEEIVGRALAGRRDEVIVSTKAMPEVNGHLLSAEALRGSVEKSLGRLRTDHVDLFFVHGVGVQQLQHCRGAGPRVGADARRGKDSFRRG